MPTVFAGIFEEAPRDAPRPADAVRRALALEEGEATVRQLGPLTLGWTGPGAHESADVTCVVDGWMDPLDVAGAYRLHGDDAPRALRDDFSLLECDSDPRLQ